MEKLRQNLSTEMIHDFRAFLLETFGLNFFGKRDIDLERSIETAATKFSFSSSEAFAHWVIENKHSDIELGNIAENFTVGETYFFREKKTLDFLEQIYVPGLVYKRRGHHRTLRIWSAGCASGEEAYTIAILLHRLIPDLKNWDITILATDINPAFLEKARKGIYTKWSFRNQPDWLLQDYFIEQGPNEFHIIPEIKKMVQFSFLNLAEASYPSLKNNTTSMDIVFCRNVLIYFSQEGIKNITRKFFDSLQTGGVLLVSPVEMSNLVAPDFGSIHFAGLTIYQKESAIKSKKALVQPEIAALIEKSIALPIKPINNTEKYIPKIENVEKRPESVAISPFHKATKLVEEGSYEEAESLLSSLIPLNEEPRVAIMKLLIKTKANLGKLEEASRFCDNALQIFTTNESLYYLKATILMEQGKDDAAFNALNRAIYLKPNFVLAHFLLGTICYKLLKENEGSRHYKNMADILAKMDDKELVPESEGITVAKFIKMIDTIKKQY